MKIVEEIYNDIFNIICEQFFTSVVVASFLVFFHILVDKLRCQMTMKEYLHSPRRGWKLGKMYVGFFYGVLIIQETLLTRDRRLDPLDNVSGGWGFYDQHGCSMTQAIENVLIFIPFAILILWNFHESLRENTNSGISILRRTVFLVFITSLGIESLQLFLCLGTFQFSDLFYNTLGGALGSLGYWGIYQIKHINNQKNI